MNYSWIKGIRGRDTSLDEDNSIKQRTRGDIHENKEEKVGEREESNSCCCTLSYGLQHIDREEYDDLQKERHEVDFVIQQIKTTIRSRAHIAQGAKNGSRCNQLIHRISNL